MLLCRMTIIDFGEGRDYIMIEVSNDKLREIRNE